MTNTEVLNNVVTEEVDHDSSSHASSCVVPIAPLNSEIHDTESTNLLVEGTFVDMILTTLPVHFLDYLPAFLYISVYPSNF